MYVNFYMCVFVYTGGPTKKGFDFGAHKKGFDAIFSLKLEFILRRIKFSLKNWKNDKM